MYIRKSKHRTEYSQYFFYVSEFPLCFFTTPCDWTSTLTTHSYPIRCKANRNLILRVFPPFWQFGVNVACFYFKFSQAPWWQFPLLGLAVVRNLSLVLRHSSSWWLSLRKDNKDFIILRVSFIDDVKKWGIYSFLPVPQTCFQVQDWLNMILWELPVESP